MARDQAVPAQTGTPIRIGLVGAGEIGTDIVSRVAPLQGIAIGAIGAQKPGAARRSVGIACGNRVAARHSQSIEA